MQNSPFPVMVFAAGFGTRMRPLTDSRPKPLIKVNGSALLDHTLNLIEAGPDQTVVVNAHYLADQIIDHVTDKNVIISLEEGRILDTGGGLRAALPALGGNPVVTMNSDAIWAGANPLNMLTQLWNSSKMDALLMCIAPDRAIGRVGGGDFDIDPDGHLSRGAAAVYSGLQIIRTDTLGDIEGEVFSLNTVWDRMIARGRVYGALYPGLWCDVGHPAGITLAESMLTDDHV